MAKRNGPRETQVANTEDENVTNTVGNATSGAEKLAEELSQEGLFNDKPSETTEIDASITKDKDKVVNLLDGGDVFNIDISKRRATVKNLLDAIKADAQNSDSVLRCFPELDPASVEKLLPSIVNAKARDTQIAEAEVEVILSLSDGEDN